MGRNKSSLHLSRTHVDAVAIVDLIIRFTVLMRTQRLNPSYSSATL